MKRSLILRLIFSLCLICLTSMEAKAQMQDDYFNKPDSLPVAPARTDTTKKVKFVYPLYNGFSVGTNILEPILNAFGQEYGSYEVIAEANILNRFWPEISFGIGQSNYTNDDDIRYKVKPSFFGRIGMSYNFLYGKERPNALLLSFRYGFSSYKADIFGLQYDNGYWPATPTFDILDQKFTSHWIEVGFGIRVPVHKNIQMGWMVYYKPMLSAGDTKNAQPWFVPGYGLYGSGFGVSYQVYFHLPSKKEKVKK